MDVFVLARITMRTVAKLSVQSDKEHFRELIDKGGEGGYAALSEADPTYPETRKMAQPSFVALRSVNIAVRELVDGNVVEHMIFGRAWRDGMFLVRRHDYLKVFK